MDFKDATLTGKPLFVVGEFCGTRPALAVFVVYGGVVWIETSYIDQSPSNHSTHFIEGEISGVGPWNINGFVFDFMNGEMLNEFEKWKKEIIDDIGLKFFKRETFKEVLLDYQKEVR